MTIQQLCKDADAILNEKMYIIYDGNRYFLPKTIDTLLTASGHKIQKENK